ncbi:MAG: hypothetical protein J7502_07475 [Flavisolibacter sp.]|nr:hypothetical protein [Flavisolibacter sp.]
MKVFLLSIVLFFTCTASAQNGVQTLPTGKYETVTKTTESKWEKGDIILLDGNKYKLSTTSEEGDYRFSHTAQRIFFTSGPLKGLFAKTSLNKNSPVIVLPVAENDQIGFKLSAEVWCYYRR